MGVFLMPDVASKKKEFKWLATIPGRGNAGWLVLFA